jgi:anti-sigma regulatory factor (Ser/Thr protein kinase)
MKELILDATIENIGQIISFADAQLEEIGCPVKIQMQFDIAIDEIVSNIARYAYMPDTGKVSVGIVVTESPLSVTLSFMDDGAPFDPLQKPDPDVTRSADERDIGGLGIYMVKKSMDDILYERCGGKNILTIRKEIKPNKGSEEDGK